VPEPAEPNQEKRTLRPGQVEIHLYSLDQVKVVASPMRALAFGAFHAFEPRAVSDVAKLIAKSPQSLYHHVQILTEVGLLLPVETRQKRSRTETLFVTIAPICRGKFHMGEEYERYRVKAFKLEAQKIIREYSAGRALTLHDESMLRATQYRRHHIRMTPERAHQLIEDISILFRAAVAEENTACPNSLRFNVLGFLAPMVSESKERAKNLEATLPDLLDTPDVPD